MNIFIIPSWYPSHENTLNGVFILEQTSALATLYPGINFGISLWGQNDERYLLHVNQPLRALKKLMASHHRKGKKRKDNLVEFFSPAYSYTSRINRGNIAGKIKACENNLQKFESLFGKADVIHAHVTYPAGHIAAQLSARHGIPYVLTEHMTPFPQKYHLQKPGVLKPGLTRALNQADRVIAVSRALKKRILTFGISNAVEVIPNFIDRGMFQSSPKASQPVFTFVTVCGLHLAKGLEEMLQAIKMVISEDEKFAFIIVGDGPHKARLKKLSQALSLSQYVRFEGFQSRERIPGFYAKADAHILVSSNESFGVVYIEAMASGIPSIAHSVGGPLDILNEDTGVFVESLDPRLIADKMLWMKKNHHKFDRRKIMARYEQKFSPAAVAPKIVEMYRSILPGSQTGPNKS